MRGSALFLALSLGSQVSLGQAVCDAALVQSTYNSFSSDQLDYRLATSVTESSYNQIKHDAGANAVIYGIPVGASYADYQAQAQSKQSTYNESLSKNQIRNILWTGLDANSPGAYSECLRAQVLASRGLHLSVTSATKTDISLQVSWVPQGHDPDTINPKWSWVGAGVASLPTSIPRGDTTVVVPRPKQEHILAINYGGFSDRAVLEPLAKLPVIPPLAPVANTTEVYWSDEVASGACAAYGNWATLCSPNKPDGWKIASQVFELTGDRAGCTYAECKLQSPPTETQVCYVFHMQGHNEECGHSGNTGIHNSKGKLTVTWAHR